MMDTADDIGTTAATDIADLSSTPPANSGLVRTTPYLIVLARILRTSLSATPSMLLYTSAFYEHMVPISLEPALLCCYDPK